MASTFWTAAREVAKALSQVYNGRQSLIAPSRTSKPIDRALSTGSTPGWPIADHWTELGHMTGWSFPAVDAIARQIQNASRVLYARKQPQVNKAHAQDAPAPQRTPIHEHPMLDLLERPNPVFWGEMFFYQLATHYCLTGGWVVWEVRDKQTHLPCELWALPRAWLVFQMPTAEFPLGTWRVNNPKGLRTYGALNPLAGGFYLDVRDTIVLNRPHPLYPGEPLGTMKAMAQAMDIAEQTDTAVWTSFIEAPRPGMILIVDPEQPMDDAELKRLADTVTIYKGGANNTGKVIALQGVSVDRMGTSVNDLDSVNARKQNQEFVNAAHSVPPMVTGIRTETGSYAGDTATRNTWTELHIQPMCNDFAGCLNHRFYRYWPDVKLEMNAKRADDDELQARKNDSLKDAVKSGGATWNEWRATQNLPPRPELDEIQQPPQPASPLTQNFHGAGGPPDAGGMDLGLPGDEGAGLDLDLDLPDEETTGAKRPELQRAGGRKVKGAHPWVVKGGNFSGVVFGRYYRGGQEVDEATYNAGKDKINPHEPKVPSKKDQQSRASQIKDAAHKFTSNVDHYHREVRAGNMTADEAADHLMDMHGRYETAVRTFAAQQFERIKRAIVDQYGEEDEVKSALKDFEAKFSKKLDEHINAADERSVDLHHEGDDKSKRAERDRTRGNHYDTAHLLQVLTMDGYDIVSRWIEQDMDKRTAKHCHPWIVKGMGRWDPSKHPRQQSGPGGGQFTRGSGGGSSGDASKPASGPPRPPAPPGSRHNPDLDAAMGMEPNKPAVKPARTGGDPFAEYQPGSQDVRQFPKRPGLATAPPLPHERTQQLALHAAQNVKPGDAHSHAAAVQALDAHMRAGLAELRRRAEHAGPRAGNMYRQAAQTFRAKLSNARARIDQLAGRGPPTLPGKRPPPLPAYRGTPPPVPRRPGQGPPPLADRGRVRPWVPLKAAHPWIVKSSDSGGRWITIGGTKGADGKRHGGSPVFIKGGKIVKGHPSLTGKDIGNLKGESEHGSHRSQLAGSRDYEVARWRKQSRKAGHDPKHLDELAAQIKAHHDAFANERKDLLRHAREHSKKNDFADLRQINATARHGGDWTKIRGFDNTAEATVKEFPHHFHEETGEHGSHEDQLYDMLTAGDPSPMSHGEAYEQAFEQLGEARLKPKASRKRREPDTSFDFGANVKTLSLEIRLPRPHPWLTKGTA